MTTRYVGSGGNDGNSGLTWALRKLTLNGVEDTPVVAGDTVYVGPGVYREMLTCDVSGAAGSPITYIGDVTGEHTDGVGGIVRITGSDNDTTATRNYCITGTTISYRTFRGLAFDMATSIGVYGGADTRTNWIIEDCSFRLLVIGVQAGNGANQANWTIRRCYFDLSTITNSYGVQITHTATVNNTGHVIENCIFRGAYISNAVARVGGVTVRNNLFLQPSLRAVAITAALAAGQTLTVYNNVFHGCFSQAACYAVAADGTFIEDYNAFFQNTTARTNVAVGAHSNTYPPLFDPPILLDGFALPWQFGRLSKWSQIARIADGGTYATDDYNGFPRPVTDGNRSWGAVQYPGAARETTTIDGSSGASIKLPDAGEQFLMRVPVTAVSTTITIKVYREADYAGTLPQMIVRQAGQADNTTTDTGAAAAWNTLTATLTPASSPGWVDVVIKSNNTAAAGSYACYFDTVDVT